MTQIGNTNHRTLKTSINANDDIKFTIEEFQETITSLKPFIRLFGGTNH